MDTSLIWYTCSFCRKVFRERIQLVNHKKSTHLEQIKARILLKRTRDTSIDDEFERDQQNTNHKDEDANSNGNDVNNRVNQFLPSKSTDDNDVIVKITEKTEPAPPVKEKSTTHRLVNHDDDQIANEQDDGPVNILTGTTKRLMSTSSSSSTTTTQQDCRRQDNDAEINSVPIYYNVATVDKSEAANKKDKVVEGYSYHHTDKLTIHHSKLCTLQNNQSKDLSQETLSLSTKGKIVDVQLLKGDKKITETTVTQKDQHCKRKNSSSKSPDRPSSSHDNPNTKQEEGGGGKKKRRSKRLFTTPKNRSVQVMCNLCKKFVREDYLSIHHQKMHVGVLQTTTNGHCISTKKLNSIQSLPTSTFTNNNKCAETQSSHRQINNHHHHNEKEHQRPVNVPIVRKSLAQLPEPKHTQTQMPNEGKTASPMSPSLACEFCSKTFKSSLYFDRHVVVHAPFKCTPCHKTFWYWQSFKNHKHSVH